MNNVIIRPISKADISFVLKSWLRSAQGFYYNRPHKRATFYASYTPLAVRLLAHSGGFVACDLTDPWIVYGYVVAQRTKQQSYIHFIYTKRDFRRMGIAKALIDHLTQNQPNAPIYTSKANAGESVELDLYFPFNYLLSPTSFPQVQPSAKLVGFEGYTPDQINFLLSGDFDQPTTLRSVVNE